MRTSATSPDVESLPLATSALAVVAHPDDESFGLGAVLAGLAGRGARVRVICFTHGEASTLGAVEDLGVVRARELREAASSLGVEQVTLLDYPDGSLSEVPVSVLEAEIDERLADTDLLVCFEPRGVTGHPDHQAASRAAQQVAARHRLPLLQWGVTADVAIALNRELGTAFVAADGSDVQVDRAVQMSAISCHRTQAWDNPVLRRRLELQGDHERIRLVNPEGGEST